MTERTVDPRLVARAHHCTIVRQVVDSIRRGADPVEMLVVGLLAASEAKREVEQIAVAAMANSPTRTAFGRTDR